MGWRVTNNSPSGHLRSIEALAGRAHIGPVHLLLAAALVTIRIYNYAAVSPAELAAARANADRVFQDAGMSLQWVNCRVSNSAEGDACTELLRDSGEFVLRLQTAWNERIPSQVALGSSLIDGRSGGGVLITIDPRLVHVVALQAQADPSTVLGRAIAHELGHLLIGTPGHSRHGLMRALWSQGELRGNRAGDWRFSADEAELMRRTIAKSVRAAN
jgi:hypothetical protein